MTLIRVRRLPASGGVLCLATVETLLVAAEVAGRCGPPVVRSLARRVLAP